MAKYRIKSEVVLWPGEQGAWHFAYVDKKRAAVWREKYGKKSNAWASIRVKAKVGKTEWETSIFWDKQSGTYVLPLKASVRHAESIDAGDTIALTLDIV